MTKIPGRIARITVDCPAFDDEAGWQRIGRNTGVDYHPVHGGVLRRSAKPWMEDVRRFYEKRLAGVDLITATT